MKIAFFVFDCAIKLNGESCQMVVFEGQKFDLSHVSVRRHIVTNANPFLDPVRRILCEQHGITTCSKTVYQFMSAPFFEGKVGLRLFLESIPSLSHWNPPFKIFNRCTLLVAMGKPELSRTHAENTLISELEKFLKSLSIPCDIVVKSESITGLGRGNSFLRLPDNPEARMSALLRELSVEKSSNFYGELSLEACKNVSLCEDGTASTYRLAISVHVDNQGRVVTKHTVVFQDIHEGFDSHQSTLEVSVLERCILRYEQNKIVEVLPISAALWDEINRIEQDPILRAQMQVFGEAIVHEFSHATPPYYLSFKHFYVGEKVHQPAWLFSEVCAFFKTMLSSVTEEQCWIACVTILNQMIAKIENPVDACGCKEIKRYCVLVAQLLLQAKVKTMSLPDLFLATQTFSECKGHQKFKKAILRSVVNGRVFDCLFFPITETQIAHFLRTPLTLPDCPELRDNLVRLARVLQ